MQEADIRTKCLINSNKAEDKFVGLECNDGNMTIHFPMGYRLAEDDRELRKDILLLFSTLAANLEHKDSELLGQGNKFDEVDFPVQSYLYIIRDYYARGYFKEQEINYRTARQGKINWGRTIKTQHAYMQDNDVFYLDFMTKKNTFKENELITLIHKYCVYESFEKIGWLFTKAMPEKVRMKKNKKMFIAVINAKLADTFNDKNRMLLKHMNRIIESQGDPGAKKNYMYGTYRFEYVWEKLIDKVFGIANKVDYFPKTSWQMLSLKDPFNNASLEPDTIMLYGNDVYILDAKYYKYGVTGKPGDLPGSASINKQITYGEYVAGQEKFKKLHGETMQVFNAFIMPFDALEKNGNENIEISRIGVASADWKNDENDFEKIQGILIDVKTLMKISVRQDADKIMNLAKKIKGC